MLNKPRDSYANTLTQGAHPNAKVVTIERSNLSLGQAVNLVTQNLLSSFLIARVFLDTQYCALACDQMEIGM